MKPRENDSDAPNAASFEAQRDQQQLSLPHEFILFLRDNKKWWMVPILIVLLLVTALVTLTSTGVAPFIYSLF